MRAGAHGPRGRDAARRPRAPEHRPHQEPGLLEADQVAAAAREVFYPGPVLLDPLAPAAIVALFGAWLGPLRTEATRPEHELNERKSAPYSSSRALGCCRPQLGADGRRLKNQIHLTPWIPASASIGGRRRTVAAANKLTTRRTRLMRSPG